jgi:hypothetical protein
MDSREDPRKIKCFDGLCFAFDILEYNYQGLHNACSIIKDNKKNLIPALSRCWSIIDQLHRIREISQAIPSLSHKNCQLVEFLEATQVAELCRHYIQHLRSELLEQPLAPFPVWGALSWVDHMDATKAHTVIMGTQLEGIQYASCVYDSFEKKWVSTVTLGVRGISVNFDQLYEEASKFRGFILSWIFKTYHKEIKITEVLPIYTAAIMPL